MDRGREGGRKKGGGGGGGGGGEKGGRGEGGVGGKRGMVDGVVVERERKRGELECVYVCMCACASVTIATAYGKYTADLMQCITMATVQTDALTSSPEHHTASSCAGSHASSAERKFYRSFTLGLKTHSISSLYCTRNFCCLQYEKQRRAGYFNIQAMSRVKRTYLNVTASMQQRANTKLGHQVLNC